MFHLRNISRIWERHRLTLTFLMIEKIEKVDDHTVRFVLTRSEAPFIADMAMDFASMASLFTAILNAWRTFWLSSGFFSTLKERK